MWIATPNGISLVIEQKNGLSFKRIGQGADGELLMSNKLTHKFAESKPGYIWVGTGSGLDLMVYEDPTQPQFFHFSHDPNDETSISSGNVNDILVTKSGQLFVSTFLGGLNLGYPNFQTGGKPVLSFQHFYPSYQDIVSHSDNFIADIYEDEQGLIWLCAENRGLIYFNNQRFPFHQINQGQDNELGLSGNSIIPIFEDQKENLWFGVQNRGLNILDRKNWINQIIESNPGHQGALQHNLVITINEDRDQNIWLGTFNGMQRVEEN